MSPDLESTASFRALTTLNNPLFLLLSYFSICTLNKTFPLFLLPPTFQSASLTELPPLFGFVLLFAPV